MSVPTATTARSPRPASPGSPPAPRGGAPGRRRAPSRLPSSERTSTSSRPSRPGTELGPAAGAPDVPRRRHRRRPGHGRVALTAPFSVGAATGAAGLTSIPFEHSSQCIGVAAAGTVGRSLRFGGGRSAQIAGPAGGTHRGSEGGDQASRCARPPKRTGLPRPTGRGCRLPIPVRPYPSAGGRGRESGGSVGVGPRAGGAGTRTAVADVVGAPHRPGPAPAPGSSVGSAGAASRLPARGWR